MDYQKVFENTERLQYGYYQFLDHFIGRERSFRLHNKSRRKLYATLHKRFEQNGRLGQTHEIERRKDLSLKEFKNHYIKKGIPVVLEGKANDWACSKNWSLDYFKKLYGEEEILFVNHEAIEDPYERILLKDILEEIQKGNKSKYYRFYPLLQRHPEHIKDFDYEWILKARQRFTIGGENFQVFAGAKGSYTPMHNAFSCNIFTQAYGQKEWYLYPPYYSMIFDPDPAQNIYRNISSRQGGAFNPFEPDYEKFPLFKYIDRIHVELNAGDVFYNPPYWWHAVKNPSESIGVGYRWMPPLHCFKSSPLYYSLDLCTRNPTIFESLKLAKTDINLIQLSQTGRLEEFLENKRD